MQGQCCKDCGDVKPMTREFFGNTPNGNFRTQCRTCMRAHVKGYSDENKDGVQERNELRRQRIIAASGEGYDQTDVSRLRRAIGDKCAYCDTPLNGGGHVDHKTPISRGGANDPANITICCERCNLAKHAKAVDEFLIWRTQRGLKNRHPRIV